MSQAQFADALRAHRRGATVAVRVVPRARRTACVGVQGGALKLKVAAPPVDGAANTAVVSWVADVLGRRVRDVELIAGERGRDKVLLVVDASPDSVASALAGACYGAPP